MVEKRRRPTGADVARTAGVSVATVSYVLNNAAGQTISEATKSAVWAAAEQLDTAPIWPRATYGWAVVGVVLFVIPPMGLTELDDPGRCAT